MEVCGIKRNWLTGLIEEHGQVKTFTIDHLLCENNNKKYEFVESGPVTEWTKEDEEE